jgi:hypothetical protein
MTLSRVTGQIQQNFNPGVAPFDAALSFGLNVTLTASGFAGGAAPASNVNLGVGRVQGTWSLLIPTVPTAGASQNPGFASSNESYQFFLLGSNDPAFGNGNVEILNMHDLAATAALRDLPNVAAAFPTSYPFPGFVGGSAPVSTPLNSVSLQIPFSNQRDAYIFSFVNLFVQIAGTTPSIEFSSWLTPGIGQKS